MFETNSARKSMLFRYWSSFDLHPNLRGRYFLAKSVLYLYLLLMLIYRREEGRGDGNEMQSKAKQQSKAVESGRHGESGDEEEKGMGSTASRRGKKGIGEY